MELRQVLYVSATLLLSLSWVSVWIAGCVHGLKVGSCIAQYYLLSNGGVQFSLLFLGLDPFLSRIFVCGCDWIESLLRSVVINVAYLDAFIGLHFGIIA